MKKLSLQNAKSMLSRAEMIAINGGYDGSGTVQEAGWGKLLWEGAKAIGVEKALELALEGAQKVGNMMYDGAKQSAEAQVNGGTQVMIPGAVGTTTSVWVK